MEYDRGDIVHWGVRKQIPCQKLKTHYNDVIMGAMASQITSLTIVYSTVYSDADQRKHQSFPSLAFVRWIHRWPVNSSQKWPVTRKMFPFDDVIIQNGRSIYLSKGIFAWFCKDYLHACRLKSNHSSCCTMYSKIFQTVVSSFSKLAFHF